jgi:hypothetical protein
VVNVTVTSGGTSGPRGSGWLSGTGAPADTVGFDGDFYLDTANTGVYYGPKTAGIWGASHPFNAVLVTPLPVNQGGTGSATQNFVDLTTDQTVAGNKTLSGYTTIQGGQVNQGFRFFGTVGFFGDINVGRQTVTGSRGGNAALASLLTALAALGLITDNTTP